MQLHSARNRLVQLMIQRPSNVKNDVLSGLTVSLALVPEAIAFAFVAGVDPKVGLYAAFMMGLITAVLGGRPGMISGATGAVAVIFAPLVAKIVEQGQEAGMTADMIVQQSLGYLFAAVIFAPLVAKIVEQGQGVANIVNGFFGGMGGCAMIGQSMINIRGGGRSRLSGITAAVALLGFILFGAALIEQIPLAALVGVMFMVVIGTFEWSSLRLFGRIPLSDVLVIVIVSVVTVLADLAIAVLVGIIVSALVFAWEHGKVMHAARKTRDGNTHYHLEGPLFFGSVASFKNLFRFKKDSEHVFIDFQDSRVWDHSGIEALQNVTERYNQYGKKLHLLNLSSNCKVLLGRAENIVELSVIEGLEWHVADDALD